MDSAEKPTYIRQRYLLSFIDSLKDKGISRTNLQKLVFMNENYTGTFYYDFMPYQYGPYSFQMEKDIDSLCMNGFMRKDNNGKIYAVKSISFPAQFSTAIERGKKLLRRVYREYPYYAVNSNILTELFSQEEAEEIIRKGQVPQDNRNILFTIGYEGRSLEAFINILIKNNIRVLCDVRKNPISRKFGFSGKTLARVLEGTGIKYTHIAELGIDSAKRAGLNTADDYDELFAGYRDSMNDRAEYIEKVHGLFIEYGRIALMCYEREPLMCHRNIIREEMTGLYGMESVNL